MASGEHSGCDERYSKRAGPSLLAGFNGVSVLTRDYLDLRGGHHFVLLHLKRRVLHNKRPYVVAETIGVEVALRTPGVSHTAGKRR